MKKILLIDTPCGRLGIAASDEAVTGIYFDLFPPDTDPTCSEKSENRTCAETGNPANGRLGTIRIGSEIMEIAGEGPDTDIPSLLAQAGRELNEYFAGRRRTFTFPVSAKGTPFQQKVWRTLQTIPYGETRTYGQIAAQIGHAKAMRAVGMANHRNPLPIVIPCHRVVGADGKLTGYAGGVDKKSLLLRLEKQ